jgi:transcriptional regulator with XRE-family HTH domain
LLTARCPQLTIILSAKHCLSIDSYSEFWYFFEMAISDQLRQAIRNSGLSLYEIAKAIGITDPILSRFLSDDPAAHRDIRLERTADKLAEFFGMKLTEPRTAKAKPTLFKPNANKRTAVKKRTAAAKIPAPRRPAKAKQTNHGTTAQEPGQVKSRKGKSRSRGRGLTRRLTPAEMDVEIERVNRAQGRPTIYRGGD